MPNFDWIATTPRELVVQIGHFLAALDTEAGRTKSKLTKAQFDELRTNLSALTAQIETKEGAETALAAAQKTLDLGYDATAALFRTVGREAQGSSLMDDPTREAAGLTVRKNTSKGFGEIPVVEDLICKPRPSGDNFLDWSGPTGGGITYDIETRAAEGKPWEKIGYTTRTAYLHESAGAGVHREYRIVPQRSGRSGKPGNVAAAY